MYHHGEALRRLTHDDDLVHQLKEDYRQAAIIKRDRLMLDYVAKLTQNPWTIGQDDIENLKAVSFSDREIVYINQIAGFYAFVNRQILGLGIELETEFNGGLPSA